MPILSGYLACDLTFSFFWRPNGAFYLCGGIIWSSLYIPLIWQFLVWGPAHFPRRPALQVRLGFLALVIAWQPVLLVAARALHDPKGFDAQYLVVALAQLLFLRMLYKRGSLEGHSLPIAIANLAFVALGAIAYLLFQPGYRGSATFAAIAAASVLGAVAYLLLVLRMATGLDRVSTVIAQAGPAATAGRT
jgi:hypothetical protein